MEFNLGLGHGFNNYNLETATASCFPQVVVQHAGVMPVMVIVAVLNFGAAAISQTCISDELWTIQKAQMDEDVDGMHREGAVVGDEDPDVVGLNTA